MERPKSSDMCQQLCQNNYRAEIILKIAPRAVADVKTHDLQLINDSMPTHLIY